MNLLDIMALAIIALSTLGAFSKGLVAEAFALAGVIVGFLLASHLYDSLDVLFLGVASGPWADFLAFITIFVLVIVIASVAGTLLGKLIKKLAIVKWADRLLGSVFGLVRGWLVVSIVFLAFAAFGVQKESLAESKTGPFFLDSARAIIVLVPEGLKEKFARGYKRVFELWIGREK
jgi:membrane protein required for colicin V production